MNETHLCGDPSECHYDEGIEVGRKEREAEIIALIENWSNVCCELEIMECDKTERNKNKLIKQIKEETK